MKQSKKISLVFLAFFLACFSANAFAADPFDTVNVASHGSWQWAQTAFNSYSIGEAYPWTLNDRISLDIDDEGERNITIMYLDNVFDIKVTHASDGGQWVNVTITRLVQGFKGATEESIVKTELLDLSSDKRIYFQKFGISVYANYELTYLGILETDVLVERITLDQATIQQIRRDYLHRYGQKTLAHLGNVMKNANTKFRVIERNYDFLQGSGMRLYATPLGFDEEDNTGKTRSVVITENGIIKYLIMIPDQISTEFLVYKPKAGINVHVNEINNYTELVKFRIENMVSLLTEERDISAVTEIIRENAKKSGSTLIGMAGAHLLAKAGVTKLIGSGAAVVASKIPVIGGALTAGGATATIVATGGTIIIVAAVAGTAYTIIEGTSSHTMVVDDGRLVFNWDREYWAWWDEGKINFIMLFGDETGPQPYISKVSQFGEDLAAFNSPEDSTTVTLKDNSEGFTINVKNLVPNLPVYFYASGTCPSNPEFGKLASVIPTDTTASYELPGEFVGPAKKSSSLLVCQYISAEGHPGGDAIEVKAANPIVPNQFFVSEITQGGESLHGYKDGAGKKIFVLRNITEDLTLHFSEVTADTRGRKLVHVTYGICPATEPPEPYELPADGTLKLTVSDEDKLKENAPLNFAVCQYLSGKIISDKFTLLPPLSGWIPVNNLDFPTEIRSKIDLQKTMETFVFYTDKELTKKATGFKTRLGSDKVIYFRTEEFRVGFDATYYISLTPKDSSGTDLDLGGVMTIDITNLQSSDMGIPP